MISKDIWRKIIDFIFPKRCLGCGKNEEILCFSCLNGIPKAGWAGDKIHPALDYRDDKLKKALWLFKYGGYASFADIFGEIIYDKILEEIADMKIFAGDGKFIVIPIPLSPAKLKKRGFNQSELMARKICELGGEGLFVLRNDILIKVKETESQMSIRQKEKRLRNLVGAFAVKNGADLRGGNVIIIDDIITTGATINEATRVLKEAGAREVIAFTVAH
ncbi:MAG: phosphoribosyltransferase family protein [Patescibacteria group bacterium]|mgnify:FL=1